MGNPPILNREPVSRAQVASSRPQTIKWDVYVMRTEGRRVARDQLRPLLGILNVEVRFGAPSASLADEWGNDLARLDQVQIRRLLPNGALLLRGIQSIAHSKWGVRDYPSAWWCKPRG